MKNYTPEKEAIKALKRKMFVDTFLGAVAVLLAVAITFSIVIIAAERGNSARQSVVATDSNSVTPQTDSNNNSATNNENNANSNSSQNTQVADTVKLYNTAVNKVKSEAKSLTRNYEKLNSVDEYLKLPSAIESIGKSAITQFVKGSDTPETWNSKEDIKTVFPVGGEDYSSHLTADMVKSASCKEEGSVYKVSIVLSDDKITSPAKGEGYAGVFNTVTASTFNDISIPTVTFQKVAVNGIGGTINCTIDKATGRVTELTLKHIDVLALNVKVLITELDVQFALAKEDSYSIKY